MVCSYDPLGHINHKIHFKLHGTLIHHRPPTKCYQWITVLKYLLYDNMNKKKEIIWEERQGNWCYSWVIHSTVKSLIKLWFYNAKSLKNWCLQWFYKEILTTCKGLRKCFSRPTDLWRNTVVIVIPSSADGFKTCCWEDSTPCTTWISVNCTVIYCSVWVELPAFSSQLTAVKVET